MPSIKESLVLLMSFVQRKSPFLLCFGNFGDVFWWFSSLVPVGPLRVVLFERFFEHLT